MLTFRGISLVFAAVYLLIFWVNPFGFGDKTLSAFDLAVTSSTRLSTVNLRVHNASEKNMLYWCTGISRCPIKPGEECEISPGYILTEKGIYEGRVVASILSERYEHYNFDDSEYYPGTCSQDGVVYMSYWQWLLLTDLKQFEKQKSMEQADLRYMQEIAAQASTN